MTFTEAAAHVLRLVGKPLHYKEITDVAIERGLLSHVGKSPEVTMGARLAAQVKKADSDNPLARLKPGVFALSDWDDAKIKKGLADRTPALELMRKAEEARETDESTASDEGSTEVEGEARAPESADPTPVAVHREIEEVDDAPPDEEERRRAELSAAASQLFESEDDDDQPIFGRPEKEERVAKSSDGEEGDADRSDGKRRRRRRRGRGRKDEDGNSDGGEDLPTYTVSDADPDDLPSIDSDQPEPAVEDFVGGESEAASLSAALEACLSKYDRGRGPVSAQNLADGLKRATRGEVNLNAAAVVAIARIDSLAAERSLRTPRFRVSGNKVGLTSWSWDKRMQERVKGLERAAEQLRESTVRALSEELKRLPQRAIGEIIVVLLDRMGVSDMKTIHRQGSHGSELHLSGVLSCGLDARTGGAVRLRTAIMIRRDGKDVGRERVTELRGAMHHYGPASNAWIISTGQVLSGAREEAQSAGGSPVTLSGRHELADLCLAYGVGVRVHRLEVPAIDVELFEGLQGR